MTECIFCGGRGGGGVHVGVEGVEVPNGGCYDRTSSESFFGKLHLGSKDTFVIAAINFFQK